MLIYKILRTPEWTEFEGSGSFEGSPDDKRDGFIHCSSRSQLTATAHRFFGAEPALVVLAIPAEPLGDSVRWEPSGGGELFPHIYGTLPREAVGAVHHVPGADEVDATVPPD